MTEQYQCQSYYDDNNVLQDCTCGKCIPTKGMVMKFICKLFGHTWDCPNLVAKQCVRCGLYMSESGNQAFDDFVEECKRTVRSQCPKCQEIYWPGYYHTCKCTCGTPDFFKCPIHCLACGQLKHTPLNE